MRLACYTQVLCVNIHFLPSIYHTPLVPPSAPTIGVVMATSSTSISVQWAASANDGGSPITGYVVEYRNTSDSASQFMMRSVGGDVFTTILVGLVPFTTYDVRVRGENIVGHSDPSATLQRRTDPDGELFMRWDINFQVRKQGRRHRGGRGGHGRPTF